MVLRSKTPNLVEQEFYGMMLAHRAVRYLMNEAALRQNRDPDRLSFTRAIRVIHRKLAAMPAFPPREVAPWMNRLVEEILRERLPPRKGRYGPRGVKRKMWAILIGPEKIFKKIFVECNRHDFCCVGLQAKPACTLKIPAIRVNETNLFRHRSNVFFAPRFGKPARSAPSALHAWHRPSTGRVLRRPLVLFTLWKGVRPYQFGAWRDFSCSKV